MRLVIFKDNINLLSGEVESAEIEADSSAESTEANTEVREIITLFSKYGNKKAEFSFDGYSCALPYTQGGDYYSYNHTRFCVCEGEGALYFLDYPLNLDFRSLDISALEVYLIAGKFSAFISKKQRNLVQDFIKIYEKNVEKDYDYLTPLGFVEVEDYLIGA